MPESKNRRRGRPRSSRSGTGASQPSYAGSRSGPPKGKRFGIRPRTWRKIRRWGFVGIAGTIGALVIVSFALTAFPGGGGGHSRGSGEAVGDAVNLMPLLFSPSNHIDGDRSFSDYSTTPPTSGPHWNQASSPAAPARCDIYDEEIRDERIVHNMEHGHVVISHNLQDPDQVAQLEQVSNDLEFKSNWLLVRPYSKIDSDEVAITSWGWIQKFQGVDAEGIKAFYDAHRNQAPEAVPCI